MAKVKTKAQLQAQITELEAEMRQMEERRQELGEDNWAADQFHEMTCRLNHTDGCSYGYGSDEDFDKDGTPKNKFKLNYLKMKASLERILSKEMLSNGFGLDHFNRTSFHHDTVLEMIEAIENRER